MNFTPIELSETISVLIPELQRYGNSNIGMLYTDEGVTFYDTGPTPAAAQKAIQLLQIDEAILPKQVILSSARTAHSGGSQTFWQAAFYGTTETSQSLDQPLNNEAVKTLLPHFSEYYDEEIFSPRTISHIVNKAVYIQKSAIALPLAGDSNENLALYMPEDETIFLGALASFGVTPLGFSADYEAWIKTLEEIQDLECKMFVPGHGHPGGIKEIALLIDYLKACLMAKGDVENLATGPWTRWSNPEFHSINVEQAHKSTKGDFSLPKAMSKLLF